MMTALRWPAALPALLLLGAMLNGCGAGAFAPVAGHPLPQSLPHRGEIALDTLLGELDSLPAPAGADSAGFAQLKAAMRAYLVGSGQQKFATKAVKGSVNIVRDLTFSTQTDANGVQTDTITWSYVCIGDYDRNSEVNIADLSALGANLQKNRQSPDWLAKARFADGDGNGEVNISDITPIGAHLLEQIASFRIESSATTEGPWAAVDTVAFAAGTAAPSGLRMYEYVPPAPLAAYYRVVPVDGSAADGVPGSPSQAFIISPLAEVVGQPGGLSFVSRNGMSVVLQAPSADPTSVAVGDILVGDDGADGFLWRVLTVSQTGDQVTVTGETAGLSDLIIKGVLDLSKLFNPDPPAAQGIALPPGGKRASAAEPLTLDCTQQTMTLPEGMTFKVNHMLFKFAPDITIRITIDAEAYPDEPVRSFIMKIDTDYMDCNFDTALLNCNFSGNFPADNEDPMYLHPMADFAFQFDELKNGIPFSATWYLDINVGVRGGGDLQGDYPLLADAHYDNATFGASWQPGRGWLDYNDFTSTYSDPDPAPAGIASSGGTGASTYWFVRGDVSATLFGDSSRETKLRFEPTVITDLTPANQPAPGFNYAINGFMDLTRDFRLGDYGGQNLDYSSVFNEPYGEIDSGFIPLDSGDRTISGTIIDDSAQPVAGLTVWGELTSNPGSPLWMATTDANGDYAIHGISNGFDVTVVPQPGATGYSFTPPTRQYIASANITGADFTAQLPDSWAHSIGFNTGDDTVRAIACDATGNVYVAGFSAAFGGPGKQALLAKYAPSGQLLWSKQQMSFLGDAQFTSLALDGNAIYTCGTFYSSSLRNDIMLVKWDSGGNVTWDRSWGLTGDSSGEGLAVDGSGNVYVAGVCNQGLPSGKEAVLLKYDSTGAILWQNAYQGPNDDLMHGAFFDEGANRFYAIGHTMNTTGSPSDDVALISVTDAGALGDQALFDNGGAGEVGFGIYSDGGVNIWLSGTSLPVAGSSSSGLLIHLNGAATVMGAKTWKVNAPTSSYHYFNSLNLAGDGYLYTAGYWQDASSGQLHGAFAKWGSDLTLAGAENWLGTGNSRFYSNAWSDADFKLLVGGYAPNNTGMWGSVASTATAATVTTNTYGGTYTSISGTLNADSPTLSDAFPTLDAGGGGGDAFAAKRDAP